MIRNGSAIDEGRAGMNAAGPMDWDPLGKAPDTIQPDRLRLPLASGTPLVVWVDGDTDLFDSQVAAPLLQAVFAVMAVADKHKFAIQTKYPERMRRLLQDKGLRWVTEGIMMLVAEGIIAGGELVSMQWPPTNVRIGTKLDPDRVVWTHCSQLDGVAGDDLPGRR